MKHGRRVLITAGLIASLGFTSCTSRDSMTPTDAASIATRLIEGESCELTGESSSEGVDEVPDHEVNTLTCSGENGSIDVEIRVAGRDASLEPYVARAKQRHLEGYYLYSENWVVSTSIFSVENERWIYEAKRKLGGDVTGIPPEDA